MKKNIFLRWPGSFSSNTQDHNLPVDSAFKHYLYNGYFGTKKGVRFCIDPLDEQSEDCWFGVSDLLRQNFEFKLAFYWKTDVCR